MLVLCIGLFLTDQRSLAGRILAVFLATGLLEFAMRTWLPQVPVPEEAARSTDTRRRTGHHDGTARCIGKFEGRVHDCPPFYRSYEEYFSMKICGFSSSAALSVNQDPRRTRAASSRIGGAIRAPS